MRNKRGSVLVEFSLSLGPVLVIAFFCATLGFQLLRLRVREYALWQKGKGELSRQENDFVVTAGRRTLFLRH